MSEPLRRSHRIANKKVTVSTDSNDGGEGSKDSTKTTSITKTTKSTTSTKSTESSEKNKKQKTLDEEDEGVKEEIQKENVSLDIPEELVLQDESGKEYHVKKDITSNDKVVLIFAYPKASTGGCTKQALGFKKIYEELMQVYSGRVEIYGLSADSVNAQLNFKKKYGFPYPLLSDPKRQLIKILGASKNNNTGTIRSHWVWDNTGKLIFENIQVSPDVSIAKGENQLLSTLRSEK